MKNKIIAVFFALILLPVSTAGCSQLANNKPKTNTYYGLFDSYVTVSSYADDTQQIFEDNCLAINEILQNFNKLFDIYNEYNGINNLYTVNKMAGKNAVEVDAELIDFIEYSIDICKKCDLEINIAMGSVLKLWHDARVSANEKSDSYLPNKNALEEAFSHTDIDSIIIDHKNSTIFITDPETQIDVGAIAKGYAAMKAAEILRLRGVEGYVLDLGGNIVAIGTKNNGEGWVTGIINPDKNSDKSFAARIEISDVSCVTSGDYERYYTFYGKNYHHIIDKDTLHPSEYFRSVTVLCRDSALADALSTALFCMPIEDGKNLIKLFDEVEVLWILPNGNIEKTEGLQILAQ